MQIKSYISIEIQFAEQQAEKQIGPNALTRIEAAIPRIFDIPRQAAVESARSPEASCEPESSNCDRISRSVMINSSRETWLFLN